MDIELWLRTCLGALLGIRSADISSDELFDRYGVDSAKAIELAAALGEKLGRRLSPALIWEFPTVRALALYLSGGLAAGKAEERSAVAAAEPIAIVGMACRFPGAANLEAFWNLLSTGKDAIGEIPVERWDHSAYFDPDPAAPGKINVRHGGFLDQVDQFEPQFFAISPREAVQMDPQQRLILELAWEALEDSGTPTDSLRDSDTGVFLGVTFHDYADLHRKLGAAITSHTGPGQAFDIIANRVSYALGLQGPSLVVDTACSSALVAVHLACMSLRNGEADMALAGGVNLMLTPETMVLMSKFGGLSPDGRCRPFDADANGFARGEGAGIVVLKSLARAVADGDRIYSVILASAVNNDGASNGLSAPNPRAQEKLLRQVYRLAKIPPQRVHYVEAHGTGTPLGDPIEARALGAVLGADREADKPLRIGSVKSNIGHLESAAGIAGLIKTALSLKHRAIPPSLHYERPNPYIDFDDLKLKVQDRLEAWPADGQPAVAGISSFGWGGTNCHVVLQEAEPDRWELFPMAASSTDELRRRAAAIRDLLILREPPLSAACLASATDFSRDDNRLALLARTTRELVSELELVSGGAQPIQKVSGVAPRIAFVFSPQGGHWVGMGRGLIRNEPVFRAKLMECHQILRELAGWDLLDLLQSPENSGRLSEIWINITVVVALQISLAALWRSWGIEPDVVLGDSIGEVAAAHVAGILDLKDAMTAIFHYGRFVARESCQGAMALVALGPQEIQAWIDRQGVDLCVAADNGPQSSVVSGAVDAVNQLLAELSRRKVDGSRVDITEAPHSSHVDFVLDEFRHSLRELTPRASSIPMISTVTGAVLTGSECDGSYWARNLRQSVLLAPALESLFASGHEVFVEIGPHPLLARPIVGLRTGVTVLPSMRRLEDERRVMLDSLGKLYQLGKTPHWGALYPPDTPTMSILPGEAAGHQDDGGAPRLFPLAAHSIEALRSLAAATAGRVAALSNASLDDLCSSAATRRAHLSQRIAVVTTSRPQLASALTQFARGEMPRGLAAGRKPSGKRAPLVFVFSGQGSQWWGMGRQLLQREPLFRAALEECCEVARAIDGSRIFEEFSVIESGSRLARTDVAQPVLCAVQIALARLWRSWGIEPDAIVGHSLGEIAAAHVSGIISLREAMRIACLRGRLMQRAAGLGKMAAVELGVQESERFLTAFEGKVEIAAINAPASTVWAGEPDALDAALRLVSQDGILCRPLAVDFAFHTVQMEPFQAEIRETLSDIRPSEPSVPIISTVTGLPAEGSDFDAGYWSRLRDPVRFAAAAQWLLAEGFRTFLEIAPHPVLSNAIGQCLENAGHEGKIFPSLRRGHDDHAVMLESLGGLYVLGHSVVWRRLCSGPARFVSLPTTHWQRQRYWIEGGESRLMPVVVSPIRARPPVIPADCVYTLEWRPAARSAPLRRVQKAGWLILADTLGVAAELVRDLEAAGSRCIAVFPGDSFKRNTPDRYTVDVRSGEDFVRLLRETQGAFGSGFAFRGVVHLWGIESSPDTEVSAASLTQAQELGCGAALRLLHSLWRAGQDRIHFWLATRGAQALGKTVFPAQSPIWGFGRVLALEHPEIHGGMVDLDPAASVDESATALFKEITQPDDENQLAFRNGARFALRLVAKGVVAGRAPQFRPDASYMITGGLGVLGIRLAGWLFERGARHLVLVARRPASVSAEADLRSLRDLGCQVEVILADVADELRMKSLFDELPAGSLRGVFHLAGTLSRTDLAQSQMEELESALRAKVIGGWILHRLTQKMALDHFVCFSSIASVWGSRGMGYYAAANQFLDTLAHHRNALALPALSINWGPWAGGGMAAEEECSLFARIGVDALTPEEALDTMGGLLGGEVAQAVVARVRWKVFKPVYEARRRRPLLDLIDETPPGAIVEDLGRGRLAQVLQRLPRVKRLETLRQSITADARDILGLPSAQPIDPEQGFFEMGMDSLMAVEFKKRLEFQLACSLPRTVAFEYPSVLELSRHLAESFEALETEFFPLVSSDPDSYEDLSEVEAEALLVHKLANMEDNL